MLAQSFLSANELGLKEVERDALIQVLGELERNELCHIASGAMRMQHYHKRWFNMGYWIETLPNCGTVRCIGGEADLVLREMGQTTRMLHRSRQLAEQGDGSLYELFHCHNLTFDEISGIITQIGTKSPSSRQPVLYVTI